MKWSPVHLIRCDDQGLSCAALPGAPVSAAGVSFSSRWLDVVCQQESVLSRGGAILAMSKAVFVYRRGLFALIPATKRCVG